MRTEALFMLIALLFLFVTLLSWFFSRFKPQVRFYIFGTIVIACSGYYLFLYQSNRPILPHEDEEGYRELVDLLVEEYTESDAYQQVGYVMIQLPRVGKLGMQMSQLHIECLFYVHERWRTQAQRGLLVSGKPFGKFEIVKAYKLEGYDFQHWDKRERPQGPDIYFRIGSFLNRHPPECTY